MTISDSKEEGRKTESEHLEIPQVSQDKFTIKS
jgi:hypothetical protein